MSVDVAGLTHRYGDRLALSDVTFSVPAGSLFAVVGPNGSGKTTLFRILSSAMRPQEGTVRILGEPPSAARRRFGVVFQSPSLDRKLTVAENLMHHGHLHGKRGADLRKRIGERLERFGIADRAGDRVEELSGGLQRRAELAKALLHDPEVLFLDEPSTGLDPGARHAFMDTLAGLEGVTVLLTTHLLEEAERCGRLAILHRGAVAVAGEPAALRAEVGGDVVVVRGREPEALAGEVRERLGESAEIVDGALRFRMEGGAAFVARLGEAFPGRFDAVTVAKPSLEDVYFRKTKEMFSGD